MSITGSSDEIVICAEEFIARGIIFAWTAIAAADGKLKKKERLVITKFAKINEHTRQFAKGKWLEHTIAEALDILTNHSSHRLYSEILVLMEGCDDETRRLLLFSSIKLACCDGDFTPDEMLAVKRLVEHLDIRREDVLLNAMILASKK